MPPDPALKPRPAMIRDPHAYTLICTVTSGAAPDQSVRCARCGKRILDPARVGSDPAALAGLRHGDVVLGDTVYVVRGPDGERSLCLHCAVQSGITRRTAVEHPAVQPPTHPAVLLWGRRWSLLALFGSLLIALAAFELFVEDVGGLEGAPWDRPILQAVRWIATPAHGPLPRATATLGDLVVTIPLCALAVLVLSFRQRWRDALYVGVAYGGALAANLAVNGIFSALNERWGDLGPGPAGGYLSLAAMGSLALLSALTMLAWPTRWRWPVLALAASLIVLVGVVRVALGADDPSDVLGGWAGSLVWTIGVSLTLIPPLGPDTLATGTAASRPPAAEQGTLTKTARCGVPASVPRPRRRYHDPPCPRPGARSSSCSCTGPSTLEGSDTPMPFSRSPCPTANNRTTRCATRAVQRCAGL